MHEERTRLRWVALGVRSTRRREGRGEGKGHRVEIVGWFQEGKEKKEKEEREMGAKLKTVCTKLLTPPPRLPSKQ